MKKKKKVLLFIKPKYINSTLIARMSFEVKLGGRGSFLYSSKMSMLNFFISSEIVWFSMWPQTNIEWGNIKVRKHRQYKLVDIF